MLAQCSEKKKGHCSESIKFFELFVGCRVVLQSDGKSLDLHSIIVPGWTGVKKRQPESDFGVCLDAPSTHKHVRVFRPSVKLQCGLHQVLEGLLQEKSNGFLDKARRPAMMNPDHTVRVG